MAAALRALAIKPFEPLRFSAAVQASLLNRLRCSRLNACAVGWQGKEQIQNRLFVHVIALLNKFLFLKINSIFSRGELCLNQFGKSSS
jgi:hypothetical protein